MPLAGMFSALEAQIKNSLTLDLAAETSLNSLTFTAAVAAVVPSGLMPMDATMVPLIPAGFSATQAQVKNGIGLDIAADPDLVAQTMAMGISVLCPMVPPAGLSALQAQLKNAITLDIAAEPDTVAKIMAGGIIAYYTAGGVV